MLNNNSVYIISELNYSSEAQQDSLPEVLRNIRFKYYQLNSNEQAVKKNSIYSQNDNSDSIKDLDLISFKRNIKDWLEKESKKNKKNLFNSNFACSPDLVVYSLPSNLELLGKLTCIDYLAKFTKISQYRAKTINYLFNKYKADDLNQLEEPYVERSDLFKAIQDFHGNSFIKMEEMMEFLDLNQKIELKFSDDKSNINIIKTKKYIHNTFNFDEFKALIAFSEKFNLKNYTSKNKNYLEYLDFCVAFKRVEHFKDNKKLENLLKFLFNS